MKLSIVRYDVKGVVLLLGAAILIAPGCQRESLATDSVTQYDGIVKFAPSAGRIVTDVKSSVTETAPAAMSKQSLTLTNEDGTYTLPMSLSVKSMEAGMATKATLINDPGSGTPEAKSIGFFATSIANTFWVTAWDNAATPSRIIPDATARAFTGGYVAGIGDEAVYMSATGYRDCASGDFGRTTQWGMMWTAAPFTNTESHYLKISENEVDPTAYYNINFGFTVRPVKE